MPLGTSSCPLYPKLINMSVGMVPVDPPTLRFVCGHDKIVKQKRSAQRGSSPMCENVPQPVDDAHPLTQKS